MGVDACFLATAQAIEFYEEHSTLDRGPEIPAQPHCGGHCATGREEVIQDDHPVSLADGIGVNL